MKARAAFSILEMLIVMALMGVVLLVSGSLLRDFFQTTKDQQKTPLQTVVDSAMSNLSRDLNGALRIREISGAAFPQALGSVLTLELVQVKHPNRFPATLEPVPVTWDADSAAVIQVVTYQVQQAELRRDEDGVDETLLTGVQGLSFTLEESRILTTEIAYLDNRDRPRRLEKKHFLFQDLVAP